MEDLRKNKKGGSHSKKTIMDNTLIQLFISILSYIRLNFFKILFWLAILLVIFIIIKPGVFSSFISNWYNSFVNNLNIE